MPPGVFASLKSVKQQLNTCIFTSQKLVDARYGKFSLKVPVKHLLLHHLRTQPYRDINLGMAAKFLGEKYPGASIVDIGANIGDTAALMATYASNPLVLVEASSYFFELLQHNVQQFENEVALHNVLVGDGADKQGSLHHWGGTACFSENCDSSNSIPTVRLEEIAGEKTCLVKSDTDGFDFAILQGSLDWFAKVKPGIMFENQIRTGDDLEASNTLIENLEKIGYRYFTVWDDPGFHMLSTSSVDELKSLNRYQYKVWQGQGKKSICNLDVLCLSERDADVHRAMSDWCASY